MTVVCFSRSTYSGQWPFARCSSCTPLILAHTQRLYGCWWVVYTLHAKSFEHKITLRKEMLCMDGRGCIDVCDGADLVRLFKLNALHHKLTKIYTHMNYYNKSCTYYITYVYLIYVLVVFCVNSQHTHIHTFISDMMIELMCVVEYQTATCECTAQNEWIYWYWYWEFNVTSQHNFDVFVVILLDCIRWNSVFFLV